MKKNLLNKRSPDAGNLPAAVSLEKPADTNAEQAFVNEECGDTMWDAVLNQEENLQTSEHSCAVKKTTVKEIITV